MRHFAWIINSDEERWLSSEKLLSNSYLFPSQDDDLASRLAGSVVFVFLRGRNGDFLSRKLSIQSVERVIDEASFNGFMLNVNLLSSFAITAKYSSSNVNCRLDRYLHLSLGITELDDATLNTVFEKIKLNSAIRFTHPHAENLIVEKPSMILNPTMTSASLLIKTVIKNHALDSIWGSVDFPNPFINFTYEYLRQWNVDNLPKWKKTLKNYLPQNSDNKIIGIKQPTDSCPEVDINFERIKPDYILTRSFVSRADGSDCHNSLEKTENAEKRHQEILKDISLRLIALGLIPMQSSSIDLAINNIDSHYSFFEIKTANSKNAISQSGKGAFQLAMYSYAANKAGLVIKGCHLIIESINDEVNLFLEGSLRILDISLLIYDSKKDWPNRLSDITGNPFDFGSN